MHRVVHKQTSGGPVEIRTDGQVVWVNGASGGMIGRLSKLGIDVHGMGGVHCLDCRPVPDKGAWEIFVLSMREHHDLIVPKSYRPRWCL